MDVSRDLVQHIAVFGESGSGKTVMLSSFYGAAQEPQFLKKSLFRVVADDIGAGARLHRNYLGMRDSARLPQTDHFSATSYSFSVRFKTANLAAAKKQPFDALRLVWHDYPGEWFEHDVSGPEEAQRRVDTFRSLLKSDVALLLVDGQRLLDNAGDEELYLKSLLTNVRNGLLALKDDLLLDGKPLIQFPRIWILALSKADLLPDWNVFRFRDTVIEKASDELEELRAVLAGLVQASDALSVGEDFLLLSSAKFGQDRIEVTTRVGLDLILPVAAILPLERIVRWAEARKIPPKMLDGLLRGVQELAPLLLGGLAKFKGTWWGAVLSAVTSAVLSQDVVRSAAEVAEDELRKINSDALSRHDNLVATLTGFKLDLEKGEEKEILLRSLA